MNNFNGFYGVWDLLRGGVEKAINTLGGGFLAHPMNADLKQRLRSGELSRQDYYGQILRVVYRILFLLIAEDRELLFGPQTSKTTRKLYAKYCSLSGIRKLAKRNRGTFRHDLWEQLKLNFQWFYFGQEKFGIPAFGSTLFRDDFVPDLSKCSIRNRDLLEALQHLMFTGTNNVLQPIDYRNIATEELGSVYESLLEMHPEIEIGHHTARFTLNVVAGSERKTTGSYYTPPSLVESLLDTALDPVVDVVLKKAKTKEEKVDAILSLNVCDPACGSGHFLIGAARRLGKHLAKIRSGEEEPALTVTQHAIRDVIGHCIYGVDINPMSVELCKISLWIESMEPGMALVFLDHRIKCGNALLGATPELIAGGIPDAAFTPIEGDEKSCCAKWKRINREELTEKPRFEYASSVEMALARDKKTRSLDQIPDSTTKDYEKKETAYHSCRNSAEFIIEKNKADLWCAAFVWKKTERSDEVLSYPITQRLLLKAGKDLHFLSEAMENELSRLVRQYRFFHWHLEFPEVFPVGERGGFDVVLGNPPWERVKLQEKEWFAQRDPAIANAPNAAARKTLIDNLKKNDPSLLEAFREAQREAEGASRFIRLSGRYPLCGRGDVNTYTVFAELNRQLLSPIGRVGCIVPSGIATDDMTKFFFRDLMEKRTLISLYDFENRKKIFPAVDSRMKFCLLTLCSPESPVEDGAELAFFALDTKDLEEDGRTFRLTPDEIAMINPNTRTCPIFRSVKDVELTQAIYRRVPVLIRESHQQRAGDEADTPAQSPDNPWGISFSRMFDMSIDSHLFKTKEELEQSGFEMEGGCFVKAEERFLPLYEGKMVTLFDHRAADVVRSDTATHRQAQPRKISLAEHEIATRSAIPMNWINLSDIESNIPATWKAPYLLGFSSVTSPTNERTFVPSLLPLSGVGNSFPIIFARNSGTSIGALYGQLASYVFDFVVRQKVGGVNLNFYLVKQFPVLEPSRYHHISSFLPCSSLPYSHFLLPRIRELTYTSTDLRAFERDCGFDGEPFHWNEKRRFLLRCELDAAFFGLYLDFGEWSEAMKHFSTPRDAIDYIMDTFPIVKRKDETRYGNYRTKETILSIYDDMVQAIRTGTDYQTRLDPPPAHDSMRHAFRTPQT